MKTQIFQQFLTDYSLTEIMFEIAENIGLIASGTRDYIRELISEGIVIAECANRNRAYRLNV